MNDASVIVNPTRTTTPTVTLLEEHVIEIVGQIGDGAWRCGQNLAAIVLRMGNGLWASEIAAADGSAPMGLGSVPSGIRIRLGRQRVSNAGDQTDLVLALDAGALLDRWQAGEIRPGATVLLESASAHHADPAVAAAYQKTAATLRAAGCEVHELALMARCQALVSDPRKGLNMFVLGLLCHLYSLDAALAREHIARLFGKTDRLVIQSNVALLEAGAAWAGAHLPGRFSLPAPRPSQPQIVVNGHTALALGVMASGMDICTVVASDAGTSGAAWSQPLAELFVKVGGRLHVAEDAAAAAAFALGASYAGKCAVTLTAGPDYALQQDVIAQAVRAEVPLVVVNLQGGDQPSQAEQGDLAAALWGSHGDTPKVVMAATGIEDAFYSLITARKIAETFGMVVVVLCDASLAHAQQAIPRPLFTDDWLAPPVDLAPVPAGTRPYDWDPATGLSRRLQPGRPGGMHSLSGLAHGRDGRPAHDPAAIEEGARARSLKLAALQSTLKPPPVFGAPDGDLLLLGWGSSQGAIEDAVTQLRAQGLAVSALHLRFIQPLPSGIGEILARFGQAMTIEASGSDRRGAEGITRDNQRIGALAQLLRSRFLRDIDCWGEARGTPIRPADVCRVARAALLKKGPSA